VDEEKTEASSGRLALYRKLKKTSPHPVGAGGGNPPDKRFTKDIRRTGYHDNLIA
jgi:hypothetical protein